MLAVGLIAAVAALRKRGVSVVRGRKAVAIWLLAALLHGLALAQRADGSEDWTRAAAFLLAVPRPPPSA